MDWMSDKKFLAVLGSVLLTLGGCVTSTRPPAENGRPSVPTPNTPGRFEPIAGRGADTIAELRATPAPAQPEFNESESEAADERTLSAKSFVKVADGYYAGIDADAHAWLQKQGRAIGADKVIFYTFPPDENTHAPSLHAAYYVRFKLPFGASFRDLTADERAQAGASGVRIGSVVGGSPAADANLRNGDIVLNIDDVAVTGRAGFEKQLRAHMGKRVTLTIIRDGATSSRLVRLGVLASEMNETK